MYLFYFFIINNMKAWTICRDLLLLVITAVMLVNLLSVNRNVETVTNGLEDLNTKIEALNEEQNVQLPVQEVAEEVEVVANDELVNEETADETIWEIIVEDEEL